MLGAPTSPSSSRNREVLVPRRKKRKLSGHYCWACDRRRPNERFSGRGHARHLCRDCARLGAEELTYRQVLRDLERCVTWEGIIPRRHRKAFERFLQHDDPRILALAKEMQEEGRMTRRLMRADAEIEGARAEASQQRGTEGNEEGDAESDDQSRFTEIPF